MAKLRGFPRSGRYTGIAQVTLRTRFLKAITIPEFIVERRVKIAFWKTKRKFVPFTSDKLENKRPHKIKKLPLESSKKTTGSWMELICIQTKWNTENSDESCWLVWQLETERTWILGIFVLLVCLIASVEYSVVHLRSNSLLVMIMKPLYFGFNKVSWEVLVVEGMNVSVVFKRTMKHF